MRLGKPFMYNSKVVTCDSKDLPGTLINSHLKKDVTTLANAETLVAGSFLMVPTDLEYVNFKKFDSEYIYECW